MKLSDVPSGHFFRIEGYATFKKGVIATETKGKDYIGSGEYFLRCQVYEYDAIEAWDWIGCDTEVQLVGEYLFV